MIDSSFKEFQFLVHQIIDPFKFSLDNGCGRLNLVHVSFDFLEVGMQLPEKIYDYTKQRRHQREK